MNSRQLELQQRLETLKARRAQLVASDQDLTLCQRARRSPAAQAELVSRGLWKPARHLELVNNALLRLERREVRRLMVFLPPRHGKSMLISENLPPWYLGHHPDHRVMLCSYEADFARGWGRKSRDILEEYGPAMYGIQVSGASSAADRWDLEGRRGGMVTAGAGGAITGKGADLLILDDLLKNEKEAASKDKREAVWDWLKATVWTRLEPDGVVVYITTRWNEDDPAGRFLKAMADDPDAEQWEVISLPALALEGDLLGRQPGEALWPERYSAATLEGIKRFLGSYFWAALYQQSPVPQEGNILQRSWLPVVNIGLAPVGSFRVRYWDKAGTEAGGNYSAGVLLAYGPDKVIYVEDVVRGQWSALKREQIIRLTAERDVARHAHARGKGSMVVKFEKEGGSGGKESAENTVRNLAGFDVHYNRPDADKELRMRPFAAQAEAGNVRVLQDVWTTDYIEELCSFPYGSYDDQVDATSGAWSELAVRSREPKSMYTTH